MSVSRTSGAIDSIGAAWCVRSRWARTSSTTFSGVRSTHGPTMRSVSGSLDASISMTRECCARSTTSPGATTVPIWMRGFDLGACASALAPGAALAARRRRRCRCRRCRRHRRPCHQHRHRGDDDRGVPHGTRGRFARAHGRQANGCRSVAPVVRSTGGGSTWRSASSGPGSAAPAPPHCSSRSQQLLDGRCYHMGETFGRPDDIPVWHAAVNGDVTRLGRVPRRLRRHRRLAGVRVLARAGRRQPRRDRAPVDAGRAPTPGGRARTTRSSRSRSREIPDRTHRRRSGAQIAMASDMFANDLHPRLAGRDRGEARLRGSTTPRCELRSIPARLVDWQPGDGWEPICAALSSPVPSRPVPARQHHRRLPRHDRPRLTASTRVRSRDASEGASDGPEEGDGGLLRALAERVVAEERLDQRGRRHRSTRRAR